MRKNKNGKNTEQDPMKRNKTIDANNNINKNGKQQRGCSVTDVDIDKAMIENSKLVHIDLSEGVEHSELLKRVKHLLNSRATKIRIGFPRH